MPGPTTAPEPARLEAWLGDLGIPVGARTERDGVVAWDVTLDGRRRFDLRTTLILDPALGLVIWAHLAPPLGDALRKSYRALLRWNDEFPFAKFSLAEDGRPILAVELPSRWLTEDEFGLALARVAGVADRLFDETRPWVWIGGYVPPAYRERVRRADALLDRYAGRLPELFEDDQGDDADEGPTEALGGTRAPGGTGARSEREARATSEPAGQPAGGGEPSGS